MRRNRLSAVCGILALTGILLQPGTAARQRAGQEVGHAAAQQGLPAVIVSDTVLTRAGSPYLVTAQLRIEAGVTLTVQEGVIFLLAEGVTIRNDGRLIISGTEDLPVLFTSAGDTQRWKYIYNTGYFSARHLLIRNATRFITSYGGTVIIDRCSVDRTYGVAGDDCIGVHDADRVLISRSDIKGNPGAGKTDALDLDGITGDTISGNTISGFSDDGIDIGTQSREVVITGNRISACEMAISIGEQSTVLVTGNLLTGSNGGIQTHTGAVVRALQNTIHGNTQGIRALHYTHETTSGGTIHITNSIISSCSGTVVAETGNSDVTVEYCLVDSLLWPGEGNITGNPGYTAPDDGDFSLLPGSVVIDTGDPDRDRDGIPYTSDPDDRDPDGTRSDPGCYPFYQSALLIAELSPSNLSVITDENGEFDDWIVLLNTGAVTCNLNGHALSDNPSDPLKHRFTADILIAPGDSLRLWADGTPHQGNLHLGFKLDGEGEQLILTDPAGNTMDNITFPRIPVNYFYERKARSAPWQFCTIEPATDDPEAGGPDTLRYLLPPLRPVFAPNGGSTAFPVSVGLSSQNPSEIWGSTDGTAVDSGWLYTGPVNLSGQATLRAAVRRPGGVPGYTHARAFYAEGAYGLPVIVLSADHNDLFGELGIHTRYNSSGPRWERPVSFSWHDSERELHGIAGIRIQGGNSVWMPKKSFRLHFRGGYGSSRLDGTPFAGGPQSFRNLVLRAGYDDDISQPGGTLLRDPFTAELWKAMGELATESTFGVLLLNNDYRGIYNVRESINETFVEDKLGTASFDLVRFLKTGPELKYGTMDAYNSFMGIIESTDFSRPEAYDQVAAVMDMNSLLNLLALVHCSQFRSWTWGAFMIRPEGGRWQWTIWDTDRSYNTVSWNGFSEYASTSYEKWPNIIPQKLIMNERFRNELINRTCDLLNSVFIPERAMAVYDSLTAVLEPEMDAEYARWNPGNRASWERNNTQVREFLNQRPAALRQQMTDYFGLSDTVEITVQIRGNGRVRLNALTITETGWTGTYFDSIPLQLEAVPGSGATFTGWEHDGNWTGFPEPGSSHRISIRPSGSATITAVFDTTDYPNRIPLVINEIMYNPLYPDASEWIELYNPNAYSVSLEGFSLSDGGIDNRFVFSAGEVIDPEAFLVVAGNMNSFMASFGPDIPVTGNFNDGWTGFRLGNSGETILLTGPQNGETEDAVSYSDGYPWPVLADGYGPSLQLIAPGLDNSNALNWTAVEEPFSTPGRTNVTGTGIPDPPDDATGREIFTAVYPNPATASLNIVVDAPVGGTWRATLLYLTGRTVASHLFTTGPGRETLRWQHGLDTPGAYILQLNRLDNPGAIRTELILFRGE